MCPPKKVAEDVRPCIGGPAPTIGLLFSGSPLHHFGLGTKNFAGAEGTGEKLAIFYLVKIAFASENLENFLPPTGYFFLQHL